MAEEPSTSLPFEKGLEKLEEIVNQLENGEVPLEKALKLFEEGMSVSTACRKQLEDAESRVEILIKKGNSLEAEHFK